jgi:hypothetical protein
MQLFNIKRGKLIFGRMLIDSIEMLEIFDLIESKALFCPNDLIFHFCYVVVVRLSILPDLS